MGEVSTAILNVLAIIALVAVATFVIVLISDLIISVIDGKNGIFFKRSKKNVKDLELEDEFEETPKQLEQKVEQKVEEPVEENLGGDVDLELAEEERLALQSIKDEANGDLEERIATLEAKQEEAPVEEEHELTDEELDRMYAELIADINRQAEEDEEEVEDEEVEEETEEVVEEVEEDEEDEKLATLEAEIAELKKLLEKEAEEKASLAKQLEERPQVETPVAVEGGDINELIAQRDMLEERLKVASKDLKNNKKEYVPLARIKKTLENDEAKLRRREAVVAKKKIMLFGVTNYVVDPEKERELAEELDQLEALRLSVQHCRDVMEENKERYPLLENTNKILVSNVEQLKADIEALNAKIEAISAGEGDND